MTDAQKVTIRFEPLGRTIEVPRGTPLHDALFEQGVEFPCGGRGVCRKCRIRLLDGDLPVNEVQRRQLSAAELSTGWRLACQCTADEPMVIELEQWNTSILADGNVLDLDKKAELGVAVDVGTTTLVAQILDLRSGAVLATEAALNPQARHGADIMSRINFALHASGAQTLRELIRRQIGQLLSNLIANCGCSALPLKAIHLVGNTAMHHLFGGQAIDALARYPFETHRGAEIHWFAAEIEWQLAGNPEIRFLPCLGGFVGSDILAGIMAVGMQHSKQPVGLIDLGTNGEIVIGNREHIMCASTAAGPAFEGAQIGMGMRATTGAIWKVYVRNSQLISEVIGGGTPRGICGSGLVDAIATGLDQQWIDKSGKILTPHRQISLAAPVVLSQVDIRELQLAKGAIAAGMDILLRQMHLRAADIEKVYLAGAFGNYVSLPSATRIGLLNFHPDQIEQAGNTALRGAKLSLLTGAEYRKVLPLVEHFPIARDPEFQELFAKNMQFPT